MNVRLIGQVVFEHCLTAGRYLHFLEDRLP